MLLLKGNLFTKLMGIQSFKEYDNEEFKNLVVIKTVIEEAEFYKCKFINVKFEKCKLISCFFEECEFIDSDISLTQFTDSRFSKCRFQSTKLMGIDWSLTRKGFPIDLVCKECDLSYSIFIGVVLSDSRFEECKLTDCDFSNAILKSTVFKECDLLKSIFTGCDMREADLRNSTGYYFDLSKNRVKGLKLSIPEGTELLKVFGVKIGD